MKVLIDEHLSPRLARALNVLFEGDHEVVHLRQKFGASVSDVEWIETLSREGRWVVISADRRITKNRAEFNAFRNSKLTGFFLSKGLYKSKLTKQAERLISLWDVIADLSERMEGGAMFELQTTSNRVKQIKL